MRLRADYRVLAVLAISMVLCLFVAACLFGGYGYLQLRPLPTPTLSFVDSVRATATAQALESAARPTATSTPSPTPTSTPSPTPEPTATSTPEPTEPPEAVVTTVPPPPQPRPTNTRVPTPTTVPVPPPSTSLARGPYLQSVTSNSIIIAWLTSGEVDSVVEYGPTEAYGSTGADYNWTSRHAITLSDLTPHTVYHYRVRTSAQALSSDNTFKTAPGPGQTSFTFVVIGNTHAGLHPDEQQRYWSQADEGHRAAVGRIMAINPDFYLHTGDLTCYGYDPEAWDDFFAIEGGIMSRVTMFPTGGEQDGNSWYGGCPRPDCSRHETYLDTFHLPNRERWYSFDYGNAHFISLWINGSIEGGADDISPGSEQYRWLESDLAQTNKTWKFAFFHFPPYSCGPQGSKSEGQAVHPLFVQYGVDMVFSGHDLNYQRQVVDGVTYIVTGGAGEKPQQVSGGCERWPVFKEEVKHVMKITVTGNTLHSVAIRSDAEGSEMDPFTLTAN